MVPNPNWPRWIYSSLVKHFNDRRKDVPFYVEGQSRSESVANYAELRVDGPYFNEVSHALWDIDILVAILIQTIRDDDDLYKIQRYSGIFLSSFTTDIPIFRFGDQEGDDAKHLMCLSLSPERNERIRVTTYGQVQIATNIAQASIEAKYQTKLYTPLGT